MTEQEAKRRLTDLGWTDLDTQEDGAVRGYYTHAEGGKTYGYRIYVWLGEEGRPTISLFSEEMGYGVGLDEFVSVESAHRTWIALDRA